MDIVGIKKKLFIIPYNNRQIINKYLYIITLGQELNQNIITVWVQKVLINPICSHVIIANNYVVGNTFWGEKVVTK
jgi:hypothetical protein